MFFQDHEKKIYTPKIWPLHEKKYDPLRVDRLLTVHTKGRLNEYITWRNAPSDNRGDVSEEGKREAAYRAAQAELALVDAARAVFELEPFPAVTDAVALEVLYDFLGWMEGKGERAGKPQDSPIISPASISGSGIMKTIPGTLSMPSMEKPSQPPTSPTLSELHKVTHVSLPHGSNS